MCSRNQFLLHLFYTTLLVIIKCGKSDILKGKQVSLEKRFSNKCFQSIGKSESKRELLTKLYLDIKLGCVQK